MATTARLDLSVWRNDDVYEFPIRVRGLDLTGKDLRMEVRLEDDTPGAPLIALARAADGNGLYADAVETVDGLPVQRLRIIIDKSTLQSLPYSGEMGDSTALKYALLIAGKTRLTGRFIVLAHAYGSNAAPANRSAGSAMSVASAPSGGATLVIAETDAVELVIDGAGELGGLLTRAEAAAATAEAAADQIETLQDTVDDTAISAAATKFRTDQLDSGARSSLGEMLPRARVQLSGGAMPITNGLRFTNGAGSGSFIVYDALLNDVDRARIPAGAKVRVRAVFSIGGALGPVTDSFTTRVVRGDPVNPPFEGSVDAARSVYGENAYIRETTVVWDAAITALGGLVQFSNVPAFSGVREAILTSLTVLIDAMPASAETGADLTRLIERERLRLGRARRITVGPGGAANSLAQAAMLTGGATPDARVQLQFLPSIDPTKADLADGVDAIGDGPTRSRIIYTGPTTLTDATRTDHDPIRLRGSNRIAGLGIRARNANYCVHSESAGFFVDWRQSIEDCDLRHDGNEAPFNGGTATVASRWVPALGAGLSSGSVLELTRSRFTSLKGGGVYVHNAQAQGDPCGCRITSCTLGGDDPVAADLTISTLGSGTGDWIELDGATLQNGHIRYVVSIVPSDPLLNGADHTDFQVTARGVSPYVLEITDPGRALRIRAPNAGGGVVAVSGAAADVLMSAGERQTLPGDAGLKASALGWYDVAGNSMGSRLGDCRTTAKAMTVTAGGSSATVMFNADHRGQSNATILAAINTALGGVASADLVSPGERYRITDHDRERVLRNTGTVAIHQGAVVVYDAGGTICRAAEPADFSAAGVPLNGLLRVGFALEDIRTNASGRVQISGWINWDHVLGDGTRPNLTDGLLVRAASADSEGRHGTLAYAGNTSSLLRCIRPNISDGQGRETPTILSLD
jgi:hypothetical protein